MDEQPQSGQAEQPDARQLDAQKLEEKAEELREQADRLGEMVEALNETMGRNFFKSWLYAMANIAVLLPVAVVGSYIGFRIAFRRIVREGGQDKRFPFRLR